MKKIVSIAIFAFFVFQQSVYSQITTNELPISIQKGIGVLTKDMGTVDLPVPDIKKLLREDSLQESKKQNGNMRISVSIPLVIDSNKDGVWTVLEDGGKLWQMEVHADKALALDFVFSKFWLPKGGKFFIFNPLTNETIGAVTSQFLSGDKSKPGRFSSYFVGGDNMILEYYQSADEKELPVIVVERAYYSYRPVPEINERSICEVNVNCSEGNNWQSEKDAVAIVYAKFVQSGICATGSLINNTQNDLTPLFLTADHILELDYSSYGGYIERKDAISDNDLSDWVFAWAYEKDCSDTHVNPHLSTTKGAIVKANNPVTDFALLQLQQNPLYHSQNHFVPYYLGWDVSGNSGTGGVCIHHPNSDYKKISTYSCTPTIVSYDSSPYVNWAVSWIATDHGHGITETASSGAPLINNDHHVIGQLRGASESLTCSNFTGTSKFGRLSNSWTGYGNSDYRRRLDYWLDPNGSNTSVINGIYPYSLSSLSGPSVICSSTTNIYTINNLPSGYTINWSLDNNNFAYTSSGYQCSVTYGGAQEYDFATLTANIYYYSNLKKQITKSIIYGVPPVNAELLITGGDGIEGRWTSNLMGNTVDIEEIFDQPLNYSQYEANLYRLSPITFEPESTPIRHWNSFNTHETLDYIPQGWYLLEVRGINNCGISDWEGAEIECIDTEWPRSNGSETELTLMYNRAGQLLTVSVNHASCSTTDNTYTLQLWSETNMVREYKLNDPVVKIPMAGLKRGLYTVRYVNRDEVIAKKFIKL